jgi:hypothetical protein
MVRALTLMTLFAALAVAGCGGSKNSSTGTTGASTGPTTAPKAASTPATPADAAAVRAVLGDLRATAAAGDANKICTQIFTRKLAVKVKNTDKKRSCTSALRRGFKATRNLKVVSVKVADAGSAAAKIRDGVGVKGTVLLVKQSGRWRIDDLANP